MDVKYFRASEPSTSKVCVWLDRHDLDSADIGNLDFDAVKLARRDSDKSWQGVEGAADGKRRSLLSAIDRQLVIDVVNSLGLNRIADDCYEAWLAENPFTTVKTVVESVEAYVDEMLIDLYAERAIDGGLTPEYDEQLSEAVSRWIDANWTIDDVVQDLNVSANRIPSFKYVLSDDDGERWFSQVRDLDVDFSKYCNGSQNALDALDSLFEVVVTETMTQSKQGLREMIFELVNEIQSQKDDLDCLRRDYDRSRGTY